MKSYLNIRESTSQKNNKFSRVFTSKASIFKNNKELVVKVVDNCLTLRVPPMNYVGTTSKISKTTGGWFSFCLMIDVPCGIHFEFDEEESNEDKGVVYFKQK